LINRIILAHRCLDEHESGLKADDARPLKELKQGMRRSSGCSVDAELERPAIKELAKRLLSPARQ
jgi:hypothetical protein